MASWLTIPSVSPIRDARGNFEARRSAPVVRCRAVAGRRVILVVMCAGLFPVQLDVSIVNVALPSIREELQPSAAGLQWVVDGYAIALASLMLAGGTMGDLYGHPRVGLAGPARFGGAVRAGLALFGVASAAGGAAPTSGVLVATRVAQGVGAALVLPGTLAIITHASPQPRERARAIGVWATGAGLSVPVGPVAGGLLVAGPGWRWVFLINLPIVAAAGVLTARLLRESADPPGRAAAAAGGGGPRGAGAWPCRASLPAPPPPRPRLWRSSPAWGPPASSPCSPPQ